MQALPRLFLLVWLPVFLLVSVFGLLVVWGSGSLRLAYHHAHTEGVSLGASPYQHGQSVYRFQVGSQSYRSEGSQGHGYIPAGEPVTVYYVTADPRLSCLDDPPRHLYYGLFFTIFFAVLLATAARQFLASAQRIPAA